jgi:SAM-dependent methyltransferase
VRVLEVGCGGGELARGLVAAGHDVLAIDPRAPEGPPFRQARLEDLDDPGPFDAVVASLSLHHVVDLDAAVGRMAALLRPCGWLVLEEWARERLVGPTARWYYHQRQALAAGGREDAGIAEAFEPWLAGRAEALADVHPLDDLRRAVDARFEERAAAWIPFLYDYRLHDALEPLERALVAEGAIDAVGFRYVGVKADG